MYTLFGIVKSQYNNKEDFMNLIGHLLKSGIIVGMFVLLLSIFPNCSSSDSDDGGGGTADSDDTVAGNSGHINHWWFWERRGGRRRKRQRPKKAPFSHGRL